jgi:putative aminopeptidase FrvX
VAALRIGGAAALHAVTAGARPVPDVRDGPEHLDSRGLADPGRDLEAFLRLAAVAGREQPAADFIRERLGRALPVRSDALGNLTVTLGSGGPRRLVACPLGEPGFVVSRIENDGYLRLAAAGEDAPTGALWQQAHEGQVVRVAGARGDVPGVVAAPSIHLQPRAQPAAPPFTLADAFVDVGAENAAQAAELGIRPLDPVALDRRPARMAGDQLAGPSARVKAACLAQVDAARSLRPPPGKGTVVFAWTAGTLVRRSGLDPLLRERGPFSQVALLGWGFGWQRGKDGSERPSPLPPPGTGLLAAGALAGRLPGTRAASYLLPRPSPDEAALDPSRIGYLGLPARYPGTPVETVAIADLRRLSSALLSLLGSPVAARPAPQPPKPLAVPTPPAPPPLPTRAATSLPTPPPPAPARDNPRHAETAALIGALVALYGVSGDETAVRDAIAARLPSWAHPVVDWAGNLSVTAGGPRPDPEPLLFMAHMDEIGFRVGEVLPDGRLRLQARGGLQSSLWEGQAALVHGRRGPRPAVFEPRPDWFTAGRRQSGADLTAWLGADSPGEAAALGVQVGTTVTMPKTLLRLGRDRAAARSLDDRAGAAVLLLALRRIDPAKLRHRITFSWTVREEIGYLGAAAIAHGRGGYRRVYPIDAFPTADSPRERRGSANAGVRSSAFAPLGSSAFAPLGSSVFAPLGSSAYAPLGHGAVLPAAAPAALLARLLDLGRRQGIPLQLGSIAGGNDGVPFQAGDAAVVPLSWPLRYTHTPSEVADLRDLEALADLVTALALAGDGS